MGGCGAGQLGSLKSSEIQVACYNHLQLHRSDAILREMEPHWLLSFYLTLVDISAPSLPHLFFFMFAAIRFGLIPARCAMYMCCKIPYMLGCWKLNICTCGVLRAFLSVSQYDSRICGAGKSKVTLPGRYTAPLILPSVESLSNSGASSWLEYTSNTGFLGCWHVPVFYFVVVVCMFRNSISVLPSLSCPVLLLKLSLSPHSI